MDISPCHVPASIAARCLGYGPVERFNRARRVGQTALSALCLEVYYRYLPLYERSAARPTDRLK